MGIIEEAHEKMREETHENLTKLVRALAFAPSVGRWPLCAVAVVGGLLMLAPQAHAAHWQMSYRPDGVARPDGGIWADYLEYQSGYDFGTGRVICDRDSLEFHKEFEDIGWLLDGSEPTYSSSSASLEGSVTIHLKWVQDFGDQTIIPPPKVAVLRITGRVDAQAYNTTSQSTVSTKFGKIEGTEGSSASSTPGEPPFQRWSQAYANDADKSVILIPLSVSEGQTEVEYSFPLQANATTQQSPRNNYTGGTSSNTGVYFRAERVDIGVAITSDIETSWKKWTGAASDLPDAYKKRDSSGKLTDQPNNKAELVAPHSVDFSKDIWKIACLRDADGKMTVESAARFSKSWFAWQTFTANTSGFGAETTYNWTLDGTFKQPLYFDSSLNPTTNGSKAKNLHVLPKSAWDLSKIDLGGSRDGQGMTRSSTLSVKATDPSSGQSLSDSYSTNWHLPYENAAQVGKDPVSRIEIREPFDFREGDTALLNNPLKCTFRSGTLWYLQDGITQFGKSFSAAANGTSEKPQLTFILDKIGELIASTDLGGEKMEGVTFTQEAWDFSNNLQTEWGYGPYIPDGATSDHCKMVHPYLVFFYDTAHWSADSYGPNGYEGLAKKDLTYPQSNSPRVAGKFELMQRPGDDPFGPTQPGGTP
jgi:hypothetical protein